MRSVLQRPLRTTRPAARCPQVAQKLIWYGTQASAKTGRRLTVWATARPWYFVTDSAWNMDIKRGTSLPHTDRKPSVCLSSCLAKVMFRKRSRDIQQVQLIRILLAESGPTPVQWSTLIYCTVHTVCERRRLQTEACRFSTFTCPLSIKCCCPAKCSARCRGTTMINRTDSKVGRLSVHTSVFPFCHESGSMCFTSVTYRASRRCCWCFPNSHDVCCGNEVKAREMTGAWLGHGWGMTHTTVTSFIYVQMY